MFGSYRRFIEVPANWKDKQVIAHFGSVTSCIYLVGKRTVCRLFSEDSKIAAEFDITPYVKKGRSCIVHSKCSDGADNSWCEDQDFWRAEGVARDSYLSTPGTKKTQSLYGLPLETTLTNKAIKTIIVWPCRQKIKGNLICQISLFDAKGVKVGERKGRHQIFVKNSS